jgi:hypothetical protein
MQTTTKTALRAILQSDPSIPITARSAALDILDGKGPQPSATETVERILRRGEVAKRFNVCIRAVDGWARDGILQKVCLPGRTRCAGFRESDVAALIAGKGAANAA